MHPLKLIKIKNPFGFLQSNPQILAERVEPNFVIKNTFSWNTLLVMSPEWYQMSEIDRLYLYMSRNMIWRSNKYCYTSDLTNRETVATTLCERVRNLWVTWELSKSDISTKFKKNKEKQRELRKNWEIWRKTEKVEERLKNLRKNW